jgi:tRNA (mo5U34)-methyltransferase
MDRIQLQQRIDEIHWYHDIDFPNGLQARTKAPQAEAHRRQWDWMRSKLDEIDFGGKNVLDIGCWDGYWSFYAEQRGASRVLASDDKTQNWAGNAGLELAKELLGSSVKIHADVSIYEVANVGERFDLILCMGVYYHLVDPFYAFSQVRHCCRRRCIVVFEGDFAPEGSASSIPGFRPAHFDFENLACCFLPTLPCLRHMLQANYFRVVTESIYHGLPEQPLNRILVICEPFEGDNTLHFYRPPFGLHAYDPRFSMS